MEHELKEMLWFHTTCKVSEYRVFAGQHFPIFELNAEIYFVNFCIQLNYGKIRTRKKSVFGYLHAELRLRSSGQALVTPTLQILELTFRVSTQMLFSSTIMKLLKRNLLPSFNYLTSPFDDTLFTLLKR